MITAWLLPQGTVTEMAKNEKKDKCKCKGCVWGRKVDDRKYLCLFPFCVKEKGHAKPEQHR